MKRLLLAGSVVLALCGSGHAGNYCDGTAEECVVEHLQMHWSMLHDACGGNSDPETRDKYVKTDWDKTITWGACLRKMEATSSTLEEMGYCLVGEAAADRHWQRCEP